MKIRIKQQMSGTRDGVNWPGRGEVMIVPDGEGVELCRTGVAEPVADEPTPERAVTPEAEKRKPR